MGVAIIAAELASSASTPFQVPSPPARALGSREVLTTAAPTTPALNRVWRVGPNQAIQRIADAAKLAQDGDTVEIQAGDYHGDVAVWTQKKLSLRGTEGRARLFADGQAAEGKAIWVFRAGAFDVSNIDFVGARVQHKNGAGIRMEGGALRVKNCLFWGNENGILTANNAAATLDIEDSEFGYNGAGDGFSHNIYVGEIAALRVTGSYFHHANVGHLLKSRAARNDIVYNRLTDERGGRASYELDLPNGGVAVVVGNLFQQGLDTENDTLIAFGLEGLKWPHNKLYLASNTLVNDHPQGGSFLRTAPTVDRVVSINNLLIGKGAFRSIDATQSVNDVHGGWELFKQAGRYDYRLSEEGKKSLYRDPGTLANVDELLVPRREFVIDKVTTRALHGRPKYVGALQDE